MGGFLGYDSTVVNGIRVGVLEDNFRNSFQPVQLIIVRSTVRMTGDVTPHDGVKRQKSNDGLKR